MSLLSQEGHVRRDFNQSDIFKLLKLSDITAWRSSAAAVSNTGVHRCCSARVKKMDTSSRAKSSLTLESTHAWLHDGWALMRQMIAANLNQKSDLNLHEQVCYTAACEALLRFTVFSFSAQTYFQWECMGHFYDSIKISIFITLRRLDSTWNFAGSITRVSAHEHEHWEHCLCTQSLLKRMFFNKSC